MSPWTWMRWRKRAQGVLIQCATGRHDVFVGQTEVLDLGLDLRQAFADQFQHVVALGQLALQVEHRQGVAQRLALQRAGVAFKGADEGPVTFAQVDVVAAKHFQRVFRVDAPAMLPSMQARSASPT
jgi:hypothetical protein